MYCKKCKNLLPENVTLCSNCKFDNFLDLKSSITFSSKNVVNSKRHSSGFSVVVLFIFLCIGVILFYSVNATKAYNVDYIKQHNTINFGLETYEYVFDDLKFTYNERFGSSKNTIFYKNNTDININIKTISDIDYSNYVNSNDCIDSVIKGINTKTFAGDNFYSYVFFHNSKYYEVRINYIDNSSLFNKDIQSELIKILNSVEIIK